MEIGNKYHFNIELLDAVGGPTGCEKREETETGHVSQSLTQSTTQTQASAYSIHQS